MAAAALTIVLAYLLGALTAWPLGLAAFALVTGAWMRSRPPY